MGCVWEYFGDRNKFHPNLNNYFEQRTRATHTSFSRLVQVEAVRWPANASWAHARSCYVGMPCCCCAKALGASECQRIQRGRSKGSSRDGETVGRSLVAVSIHSPRLRIDSESIFRRYAASCSGGQVPCRVRAIHFFALGHGRCDCA